MPNRILPNTDKLRYQVMKQAVEKLSDTSSAENVIDKDQYNKLLSILSRFEQIFLSREKLKADIEYLSAQEKAGLFLKHYLMVIQMAVQRNEMPSNILQFYGLENVNSKIPPFNTCKQILELAPKIFEADSRRIAQGGKYVTNPSIAVVKVWFENFSDIHENHKNQVEKYKNHQDFIQSLRREANQVIAEVWDDIEQAFSHLTQEEKIIATTEYGIIYKPSKKELELEKLPKTGSLFAPEQIPVKIVSYQACNNKNSNNSIAEKSDKIHGNLQSSFSFPFDEIETSEE
jgi:hypothetical protein